MRRPSWHIREGKCSSQKRSHNRWWIPRLKHQGRAASYKLVKTCNLGTGFGFNNHATYLLHLSLLRRYLVLISCFPGENCVMVTTIMDSRIKTAVYPQWGQGQEIVNQLQWKWMSSLLRCPYSPAWTFYLRVTILLSCYSHVWREKARFMHAAARGGKICSVLWCEKDGSTVS